MIIHSDKNGHYFCTDCDRILTVVFAEWLPGVIMFICHHCQIKFKVIPKGGLKAWLK